MPKPTPKQPQREKGTLQVRGPYLAESSPETPNKRHQRPRGFVLRGDKLFSNKRLLDGYLSLPGINLLAGQKHFSQHAMQVFDERIKSGIEAGAQNPALQTMLLANEAKYNKEFDEMSNEWLAYSFL